MAKQRRSKETRPAATVVRRPTKRTTRVPIGIEKVLYLAASNPTFRGRLLEDRAAAVAASGVRLTDVERSTLLGVPRPALEAMIARISPRRHGSRRLMRTVAAATVSLAAGVAAPGCADETEPETDAEVDVPPDVAGDTADVDIPDWGVEGATPDDGTDPGWTPDADDGGADPGDVDTADLDIDDVSHDGMDLDDWYEADWTADVDVVDEDGEAVEAADEVDVDVPPAGDAGVMPDADVDDGFEPEAGT